MPIYTFMGGGGLKYLQESVKFINKDFGKETNINILKGYIRYVLYKYEVHYQINVQSHVS